MQLNSSILNKVSTLRHLPTLPHILVKLMQACDGDNVDLGEVSKIVEADPSLSSKILKLINSSYYGLPKKVESIQHCISYLGLNTLKNIAIGSSISQTFQRPNVGRFFNLKIFWWHSLRTAVLARLIAGQTGYNRPDEVFLSGLLHDIGRLVLWINFPKDYSELLKKYDGNSDLILAGEIRQGMTHCEIGAWLLHRWKFPTFLVDAVLYHHESVEKIKKALPLVQITYTANILAKRSGEKADGAPEDDIADSLLGLSSFQIQELLQQTGTEVEALARLLEIEIETPESAEGVISERDREKQEVMSNEARDVSLLLATLRDLMEHHTVEAVLGVVQQGIHILFDVKDVFFFLYDHEKNSLLGKEIDGNERSAMINDLAVSMQIEESVLVASLLRREPLEMFSGGGTMETVIIDHQFIRFMDKEGMLCLPMLAHGEYVGVIVMGLDRREYGYLSKQLNLCSLLSKQAALSLYTLGMKHVPVTKVPAERAVASSDIARKVVHEVNNPLSIIKNYLKVLGLKLAKQNIAQDEIKILNKEIDRISDLLRALTSFTDNGKKETGPVDVNAVLRDLIKITRESLRKHSNIEVHMDLKPSLPVIISDENSIKQIFVNIIKNAAEAMTKGGNLNIRTRHISNYLEGDADTEGRASEGYVEVIIEDDGPGIPEEIKSRLFDPFVSTKSKGHAGLGLSIVHNTVKSLHGTLTCESEGGKGTCFKIGLPITPPKTT